MRIFLDANILFSAKKSDGAIRRLLALLSEAGHECLADRYVLEEARRNLELKEPGALSALDGLPVRIEEMPERARMEAVELPEILAEKDCPVLASAILSGADALITGDGKHFGALYGKVIGGVAIHSPRSLAETLTS